MNSKPELILCHDCRIKQGFKRKDRGCHSAMLLNCESCGNNKPIIANRHWKQISAPLKDDLREQLVTYKHKLEQAEHDLTLAKNEIESINFDKSRLKQALEIVAEWNSLGGGFCEAHDIECQRDFYRQVAQDALDIVKKLEG